MEERRYEVEVVFRQAVRYVVSAPDRETAERLAQEQWRAGEAGTPGSNWGELEGVRVAEAPGEDECGEDCEQVLRFLRDRELVIETLDEDLFNPTVHDAVSAEDVARHLGWRRDGGGPDLPRASRALERLCAQHRSVCFSRPRVRQGERGEIRLYCTPQHLERLSGLMVGEEAVEEEAV